MNNRQEGIEIKGDFQSFSHFAPIWRRSLELLHDAYAGPCPEDTQEDLDEDALVGGYLVLKDVPLWGRCKIYYETSGKGSVPIVFCHTYVPFTSTRAFVTDLRRAGADGRQYNRVMNDPRMLEKCTMYAFDLPAHGKSFPYETYVPGQSILPCLSEPC